MTTQNPRVAGYIPQNIHDRFKSFKEERKIKGDSQALAVIMSEFFKVPYSVAQEVDYSSFVTQEQFDELVSRVAAMADAGNGKSASGLLSKLSEKLKQIEDRLDVLEQSGFGDSTLANGELAKRLNMPSSTLSHWKSDDPKRGKSPEELLKATRARDPDGIGWILVPSSGRFKSERPLPSSSPKTPSEMQGVLLSEPQVAQSILSESPEEF